MQHQPLLGHNTLAIRARRAAPTFTRRPRPLGHSRTSVAHGRRQLRRCYIVTRTLYCAAEDEVESLRCALLTKHPGPDGSLPAVGNGRVAPHHRRASVSMPTWGITRQQYNSTPISLMVRARIQAVVTRFAYARDNKVQPQQIAEHQQIAEWIGGKPILPGMTSHQKWEEGPWRRAILRSVPHRRMQSYNRRLHNLVKRTRAYTCMHQSEAPRPVPLCSISEVAMCQGSPEVSISEA